VVVDKSPEHSFNIPIVYATFPEAKFIHILRDGRDVVLSISKEWRKRCEIVKQRNAIDLLRTARAMLARQPYWAFRVLAVAYEMRTNFSLTPSRFFNKAKWQGLAGWGPRFRGWKEALGRESLIRFHALQWLACVNQIEEDLPAIPAPQVLEVRYEDLVSEDYLSVVERVVRFLGLDMDDEFIGSLPAVRLGNVNKWRTELSAAEIRDIGPLLSGKLQALGYEIDDTWYDA
jgi:hypothetical protein